MLFLFRSRKNLRIHIDSGVCENSFSSSFHFSHASDEFSRSNLSDLDADNLSILNDLVSDEETRNEVQNSTNSTKRNSIDSWKAVKHVWIF